MPERIVIPSTAELVFSGVRSKVYQWNQEMYDGSIARFERVRFIDGAFIVPIVDGERILLTRQEQPTRTEFISLPGGTLEIDEPPLDGALRELREETGYTSHDVIPWFEYTGTSNVVTSVYYFIARNCIRVGDIIPDPGEKIELFTVDFDEFLELSSDSRFHHHWNILPLLYEARLDRQKRDVLRKTLLGY